ncbi:MAG TPA: hypothetical protein VKM72_13820 [Thermoanaerobaculia bacterium]|nr:hypothetical protein [Thermoanaerobaculia bacterium]
MPTVTSQADIALDWRGLIEAILRNPELLKLVDVEVQTLTQTLGEVETLKARQDELKGLRQETTQQLSNAVARGKLLAIQIRSVVRGKVGPRNERLVHFNVAPIRSRKRVVSVEPPDGETSATGPGASVSPPAKPVA